MSLNEFGVGLGILENHIGNNMGGINAVKNLVVEGGRDAHAMKKSPVMKPHTKTKTPQWIVGKVFAKWCGYCITLKGEWEKLKTVMKKEKGGAVEFIEIEDIEMENKLHEMNQTYFQKGNKKVSSTGFPTIFMFQVANPSKTLNYYNRSDGERIMIDLKTWIKKNMSGSVSSVKSETKGGRRKTGKKKGVESGTRRTKKKWGK
jgi:thiol-disulfide isomerase/thioredoxin